MLADSNVKAEDAMVLENGNHSLPNSGFNKNFKWTDENIQTALHEMAHQNEGRSKVGLYFYHARTY